MAEIVCLNEARHHKGGGAAIATVAQTGRPVQVVEKLTARQLEILALLARGFYYKEIADALGISPATVRSHLHLTYRKLQVNSRHRAVLKFHELAGRRTRTFIQ